MVRVISMKSMYGNYTNMVKEFKDQSHLDNWYKLMSNKGHKIIGITELKE
jgi:hypothetical protein